MRKKILIAVTSMALLLLFFFGFLEYRQYSSYKIPIHAGVQTIIKINADAFIKSFLKEYGINFRKKLSSSDKKEKNSSAKTGIYLPGNIFIYTLSTKLPSTFFCTIPLSDVGNFKSLLHAKLGISFTGDAQQSAGKGYNDKLTIVCSKEFAAFAYSAQKEEVISILQDLLNKKNCISSGNELIKKLKQDRSHIVCVSQNGIASFSFEGSQIKIQGSALTQDLVIPSQSKKRITDTGAYASLFLNLKPPDSWFKKVYSVKQYNLETDSLLAYFNGYADIRMSGLVNQTDTVVSYGYDDNFEKVEKLEVVNQKAPALDINMQASPLFLNYLQKQQIVSSAQKLNREVFPLYQVLTNQTEQGLYFTTTDQSVTTPQFVNTPHFLEMDIDFKKLTAMPDTDFLKKYVQGINSMNLTGSKVAGQKIKIDGSILFDAGALKTITEIIKSL